MKRSRPLLIGLVSLVLVGSGYALLKSTPDQVIHQNVSCPTTGGEAPKDVQVLGTYRWAKGVVVLYSALCSGHSVTGELQRVLGHQVVKRNGMNWQVGSSDSYSVSSSKQSAERLIEYGISQAQEKDGDRYTILYGQFLTPQVSTIEATFDNGQVLRDSGQGKAFALIAIGAAHVCDLRILGPDNQLLRREDLSQPNSLTLPKRFVTNSWRSPARCLPIDSNL
ncbi:MAG: hypothetical protein NW220_07255 [Leptolyngbyaceae cyanobacterium bins.349]|nr:hypothetical protein [Leptolyngbyaceae cyanobacterium bins.349]